MNPRSSELAIRYGNTYWKIVTGQPFVPLDLTEAIVLTTNKVGYTKKVVETLINAYRNKS